MLSRLPLRSILIKLIAGILLMACSGTTPPDLPSSPATATNQPPTNGSGVTITPLPQITLVQEVPMPSSSPSPDTSAENSLVRQAKSDLAQRLDVPVGDIELIQFEAVVWPDASLGCPQPGMAYTQVPRDGYRIRLRFEGKLFDYHGGGSRAPFLCEKTAGDEGLQPPPGLGDE